MAKLSTAARDKLPKKDFALPGGRFPVENKDHARAALSGASRAEEAGDITPSQKAKVDRTADQVLGKYK